MQVNTGYYNNNNNNFLNIVLIYNKTTNANQPEDYTQVIIFLCVTKFLNNLVQLDSQCPSFFSCLPYSAPHICRKLVQSKTYVTSVFLSFFPTFSGLDLSFQCCMPGTPPGHSSISTRYLVYEAISSMDSDLSICLSQKKDS